MKVCWDGFLVWSPGVSPLAQVLGLFELTQAYSEVRGLGWGWRFLWSPCQRQLLTVRECQGVQGGGPGGSGLTAPLLSAGEAFLGSFVASGMGPSVSSHGSPLPLPSDLSFRSPTPSNLPMVQLWAAHAHEGKECARWVG